MVTTECEDTDTRQEQPTLHETQGYEAVDVVQVNPTQVLRKISRHLVLLFFVLALICYLDRANLAFAASQLREDLHFSASTYGVGAGIFFPGYALFQIPSNLILVKVGAPIWLSCMLTLWGIVATLSAFISSAAQFMTLRFLLGVAECGAFPGMWYHLSLFLDAGELGVAYTGITTASALSQVVGGPLAAALLLLDGACGLHGWQWLFLCEGMPTIFFAVILKVCLAPSPSTAKCLTPEERIWLQKRQDDATAARHAASGHSTITGGLMNWRVWYLGLVWLLMESALFGIIFWCPQMIEAGFYGSHDEDHPESLAPGEETREWHDSKVALLSAAVFAPAALAMLFNAHLSKKGQERHWHGCVPVFAAGICLGLMPVADTLLGFRASFVLLILGAAGAWCIHGPLHSWPATFLQGNAAAAGTALINSLGAVGGFIGPSLIGWLADDSDEDDYDAAMMTIGVFLMCAGVLMLGFPEPATLQAGNTGRSHQQSYSRYKEGNSEAEIETQPILELIPWEPHWVAPHV
ncbi:hypothetical protein ABBQ38_001315 [Trebouxia sp. C0009 RCD-2024]